MIETQHVGVSRPYKMHHACMGGRSYLAVPVCLGHLVTIILESERT